MRLIRNAIIAGCIVATAGCGQSSTEPVDTPVRPVLSRVMEAVAQQGGSFVGTVEPRVVVQQAFRIGGTLVSRDANVGDRVEQDAVLGTLESTTLVLAVDTARANLEAAQAQYANAAASENRQRQLVATNNAAQADLDQAHQQAQAAQAGVVQAQSRLDQAQEQLGYAQLRAGFGGVVTAVGAEAGQVVSAGQMIVTLAQPADRDVVIDVPEQVARGISVGTPFTVAPQLAPNATIRGLVREISPEADPVTRTWRVRIAIEDPPPSFWLGTTADATLAEGSKPMLLLPETAIRKNGATASVWVVDEAAGTVADRSVTLGDSANGNVVVLSGLDVGERVVVAGVNSLTEGQQVSIPRGPAS